MKILLVDDDLMANRILEKMIHQFNAEIEINTCLSGFDCIALLKSDYDPDLIFLDIYMPKKDGWSVLDDFETNGWDKFKKAKIIMLSGDKEELKWVEGNFFTSVIDCISKPISKDQLSILINQRAEEKV